MKLGLFKAQMCFLFSLDAVLLASFTSGLRKKEGRLVDLCAGNGAVGLFLTKKSDWSNHRGRSSGPFSRYGKEKHRT